MPNQPILVEEAAALAQSGQCESFVGHQGTADAMTSLLGVPVPVNRGAAKQALGQKAICLKVYGRIAEGVILPREELEKIGFSFFLMEKIAESREEFEAVVSNSSKIRYIPPTLQGFISFWGCILIEIW
jgi:hypothetical protein